MRSSDWWNIAGGLSAVNRLDIIDRSIAHFRNADADYGERIARAVQALRPRNKNADIAIRTGDS